MEWKHRRMVGGRRRTRRRTRTRRRQGVRGISWCFCIGGFRPPTAELRQGSCAPIDNVLLPGLPRIRASGTDNRWSWCSHIVCVRPVVAWSSTQRERERERSWRRSGAHSPFPSIMLSSSLRLRLWRNSRWENPYRMPMTYCRLHPVRF